MDAAGGRQGPPPRQVPRGSAGFARNLLAVSIAPSQHHECGISILASRFVSYTLQPPVDPVRGRLPPTTAVAAAKPPSLPLRHVLGRQLDQVQQGPDPGGRD